MLRYVTLSHVMFRYVMFRYVTLRYVTLITYIIIYFLRNNDVKWERKCSEKNKKNNHNLQK